MESIKLNEINQSDVNTANRIIRELNEIGRSQVKFSELTPLAFMLVHNSMKCLNHGHWHTATFTVYINGSEYNFNPIDIDNVRLFPELKENAYFIQIHGWEHTGAYYQMSLKCRGIIFGMSSIDEEYRDKMFSDYKFMPPSPDAFIDFNYIPLNKEKSVVNFSFEKDDVCVYADFKLCYDDIKSEVIFDAR